MIEPDFKSAAILFAAIDHVLSDDMSIEDAIKFSSRWFEIVDTDPLWKDGKHCGDCTKQPMTCSRCLREHYEEKARIWYLL